MTSHCQIVFANALFDKFTRKFLTNSHIISRSLVLVTLLYGFNMFRELKSLGTSISRTLGYALLVPGEYTEIM
jgi:hypothetical protein